MVKFFLNIETSYYKTSVDGCFWLIFLGYHVWLTEQQRLIVTVWNFMNLKIVNLFYISNNQLPLRIHK